MNDETYNIHISDYDEWSRNAPDFLDYNYRQLWSFSNEAANRIGAKSEFVAISDSTGIIGLANVRIKTLPLFNSGIAYISGGPLIRKKNHKPKIETFRHSLNALLKEYTDKRNLVLRIVCPIAEDNWMAEQKNIFHDTKFVSSNATRSNRTILVDLARSETEIRTAFHQKWRNCLNRSEKNQLEIIRSTDSDVFQQLCDLFNELRTRKKFDVELEPEFYEKVQRNLVEDEKFILHIAKYDNKPVAVHLGSYLGDTAVYLLGASNQIGNKLNASYLLQWNVMLYAKEKGCHWYDLGGIDPDSNPGVFRFKKRMGGIELTTAGPFQLVPRGIKGRLTLGIERIYRFIMRFH